MDETAIYLDMLGERTLEETGTRTILVRSTGHDRDNVTVILGALGDRTKLESLMVFKGVWAPKNVPCGIVVAMSRNECNNEEITKIMVRTMLGKTTKCSVVNARVGLLQESHYGCNS